MMDMNRDVLTLARVCSTVIPPRLAHTAGPDHNAAGEVIRVCLAPGLRHFVGPVVSIDLLVIVIEDDVVKFEGEVHHKTCNVQD